VTVFTTAWLIGEEESRLHELAGYAVIGLALIRVLWGFVGTRYARFHEFVYRPSTGSRRLMAVRRNSGAPIHPGACP